ncbi:MAG: AMP-binding protein, partial [Clostridia bacterium]|nr:AMP-binding protein [Clostridia bacterium]
MSDLTLPQLLHHRAQQYGSRRIALREKDLGIWQELTWQDYFDNVRLFALGLAALGFRRGDKLAILGDNRPEWIWAELACQALGGVSVGIFQDSVASEVAYVIQHCDAVIVVAEDQEQVDKVLEVREQLPGLRHIIYYDPRGLRNYRLPELRA